MDELKVTITKEEITELFKLDESGFLKAVDKLCERILTEYNSKLLLQYLKDKEKEGE